MAYVTYEQSLYQQRQIPIEAEHNLFLNNSLRYANRFERFKGAIVPFECYRQSAQGFTIFNARIKVDVDLKPCKKFLWSARHGTVDAKFLDPTNLEVFVVLTMIQETRPLFEEILCHVLFPGTWAIELWRSWLCLWYGQKQILARCPLTPNGLLHANHQNLDTILGDFTTV